MKISKTIYLEKRLIDWLEKQTEKQKRKSLNNMISFYLEMAFLEEHLQEKREEEKLAAV